MAELINMNNNTFASEDENFYDSLSLRNGFLEWLSIGNAKKYTAEGIVSCIGRISKYAVLKKISAESFWKYKSYDDFEPMYNRLLEDKLLRVTDIRTYKMFIVAGKLYLRFLKEKPWKTAVTETLDLGVSGHNEETVERVLNESTVEAQMKQTDTKTIISSSELNKPNVIFRKEVDWSLLQYGFTIPTEAVDAFCSNIDGEVLRGSSFRIKFMISEKTYLAHLSNPCFSNDTREQFRVRYGSNSRIAIALQKIFKSSYEYMLAKKNRYARDVKNEIEEYVDVVGISPGIFSLICYPLINGLQIETNKSLEDAIHIKKLSPDNSTNNNVSIVRDNEKERETTLYNDVKVGIYIRNKLRQLSESGFTFSEQQLRNICDLQWSKRVFKLATPYPFAKIVDRSVPIANFVKSKSGYNRYWSEVFIFGDVELVFISQWYERNRSYFDKWFDVLSIDSASDSIKRINHKYMCLAENNAQSAKTCPSHDYVGTISLVSDSEKRRIMDLVSKKFRSGFRMSSNIEYERFKNYYANEYDEDFQYSVDKLNAVLVKEALIFDERAYVYDKSVTNTLRWYLEKMDSPCIYIEDFFNKHSEELYTLTIYSVEMLRAFIEKNYYDISVKWDYILLQENIAPSDLIKEVFGEREIWSYEELQKRLPFLKMDTIRQTLNGAEYLRVDKGTYTHIDNMDLPDNEGERICFFVKNELKKKDYVTANELGLSKIEDLNSHFPFTAIRDAVFYKFLSDGYDKSGQIITKKGSKLRVLDILEQYCREAETVTFEELNDFEATFDPAGRTHSQCLIAGHNTMIRVSNELFVAENMVDFDVQRIDEVIALYCRENFIPLRRVTDFSLFPYAGYQWNMYLLESYVRRFSHAFKFDVRAVNSANIGVIVKKSFKYNDYDDLLTIALANSSVRLNDKNSVGNYLFDNGYIGWRNLGKNEKKIIENAKKLREGGIV